MNYASPAYGPAPVIAAKAGISKGVIIAIAVVIGIVVFLGAVAIALGVGLGVGLHRNDGSSSTLSAPTVSCNSSASCGCPQTSPTFSSRIIGGNTATANSWPWMVALYIGSSRVCGGFLITKQHVVTAANCVYNINQTTITAYVGIAKLSEKTSGQVFNITNVAIYGGYTSTSTGNDIAVLKLGANATLSSNVGLCCYINDTSVPAVNDHAVVVGWGEVSLISPPSDSLRQAVVQVKSASTCGLSSDVSRFCAGYGGTSVCPSDNGGPLMTATNNAWTCSGIVTGGATACYSTGTYTRVGYYYNFVYNATLY
jgi:elastase-2